MTAFQLKTDEPVGKGIRRIARKQIDKAREGLTARDGAAFEDVVHDARKRLKRLRAVVRLVRDELGQREYRRENVRFRDAARPLSEVRDARALLEALDKVKERFTDEAPVSWQPLHEALRQREQQIGRDVQQGDAIHDAVAVLDDARDRVKQWAVGGGFSALAGGLKQSYRRGRRAHACAAKEPTTENLHEWRKRVKDLWHHVEILQPARPEVLDELAERTHELADLLGDDHDLAVMQGLIGEGIVAPGDAAAVRPLLESRRAELQAAALARGEELYRERPKAFVARLKSYWRSWRRQGEAVRG